jgi:serine/threonine protein kinase
MIKEVIRYFSPIQAERPLFEDKSSSNLIFPFIEKKMPTLHDYKNLKLLGEGNFGATYLASDKKGQLVALKMIDVGNSRLKGADLNSIMFEIDALANLSGNPKCYPYIACYHEYFREKMGGYDTIFIIFEHVNGPSFHNIIENSKRVNQALPNGTILKYMYCLISAINYIHKMGFAHRDIKPENIILQNDTGVPKLIDFGLACMKNNANNLGACDKHAGSPYWLPPEVDILEPEEINILTAQAQDIWSLGIVFYEMANLKFPFVLPQDSDFEDLMDAISKPLISSNYNSNTPIVDEIINEIIDWQLNQDWQIRITAKELMGYMNDRIREEKISL